MAEISEERKGTIKFRKIKLASKSLLKAKREVIRRGLNRFEKFSDFDNGANRKFSSEHKAA
jgi:hypothetical protein